MRGLYRRGDICSLSRPLTSSNARRIDPPSPGVQTGDKVDRCSETSWTLPTANQGGCRMPFHEGSRMDARLEFVMLASVEGANVRSLCRRFGDQSDDRLQVAGTISARRGCGSLRNCRVGRRIRRRAALRRSKEAVLSMRAEHPAWGGRKIARRLKDLGHEAVPVALDGDGDPEAARGRTGRASVAASRPSPGSSARGRTSCGRWTSRATSPCTPAGFIR